MEPSVQFWSPTIPVSLNAYPDYDWKIGLCSECGQLAPCPLPLALDVQLSGVNSQQQFTFTDWTRAPFSARVSFDALPLSV